MAISDMLSSHEDRLNVEALTTAIETLVMCAAHCNICADACLEEEADLTRCIRACVDCADICESTASVIARAGASGAPWLELVEVCIEACENCADECERHAEQHQHCRQCAVACRRCIQACEALLEHARTSVSS